jgi:hypothetical protein
MKKLFSFLFSIALLFAVSGSANSQTTWYEIEYSMSITSSGAYLVATCTDIPGSACNMPGSIHRSDVSAVLFAIR